MTSVYDEYRKNEPQQHPESIARSRYSTHHPSTKRSQLATTMPRLFQKPTRALQANATQDDEIRHDDPAASRIFGSFATAACGVSNDPPDEGELVDLTVCNVTQYRCSPAASNVDAVVDLEVPYDYEITYNPAAVFERVLPFVEESVLESLAAAMNLKRCAGTNRGLLGRVLQDGSQVAAFTPVQQGRFIGVSLNPRDKRDSRFAECLPDKNFKETQESACLPIQGGLTVSLSLSVAEQERLSALPEEDREEIRMGVLNFIEESMGSNVYVVPGNIDGVKFVGNREAIEAAGATNKGAGAGGDDDGGMSSTGKGLLSASMVLLFLVLLLGLFLVRKKRSRKDQGTSNDSKSRNVDLMPITTAKLEEDEAHWHSRRIGPTDHLDLSPGSLAYTDSLALEPQIGVEPQAPSRVSTVRAAPLPAPQVNVPPSPTRSSFDQGEELNSEDFAKYQINAVPEAGSSQDSIFDIDDAVYDDEVSEGNSEFTPRRVLQMS